MEIDIVPICDERQGVRDSVFHVSHDVFEVFLRATVTRVTNPLSCVVPREWVNPKTCRASRGPGTRDKNCWFWPSLANARVGLYLSSDSSQE